MSLADAASAWRHPNLPTDKSTVSTEDAPRLSAILLGDFLVTNATAAANPPHSATRFPTRNAAVLLAYLLCFPTRRTSREALAEMLWPDQTTDFGRRNLNITLTRLRKHLGALCPGGEEAIDTSDRTTISLRADCFIRTDREHLVEWLVAAERAQGQGIDAILSATRHAADLYSGPLLAGYDDIWIVAERERLQERFIEALRRALKAAFDAGALDIAADIAHRILTVAPERESAHRDLIRLHLLQGRTADAHRQMETLDRILKGQGLARSSATVTLANELRGTPESVETDPPMTATAFAEPAWTEGRQATRFYGRRSELARLQRLVDSGSHRLLTLVGVGGAGKSRLALELVRILRQRRERRGEGPETYVVPLQEADSGALVLSALRSALSVREAANAADEIDSIVETLQGRPVLLVLDNFEQVTSQGAPLLERLLMRLPQLTCLVTSRQRLPIQGEREVPVGPLPTLAPPRDSDEAERWDLAALLREQPAVALFVDRAQLSKSDFQITRRNAAAIVELAHRLEGIPLALELAAARSQVLTPRQMIDRLDKRFELLTSHRRMIGGRHHSLWEALQLSYDLLSPELQWFFQQMSLFRGGWTTEAAEAVSGSGMRTYDYLAQLRDASLIRPMDWVCNDEELRFTMLETVREFAEEMLSTEEKSIARRVEAEAAHLTYFADYATAGKASTQAGKRQAEWLNRFEADHDNFRVSLKRALQSDTISKANVDNEALRLITSLQNFWMMRGHFTEGRQWDKQFWTRWRKGSNRRGVSGDRALDPSLLARFHNGAGVLAWQQGDYPTALRCYRRSLWLQKRLGNRRDVAVTLNNLGIIESQRTNFDRAQRLYEQSLAEWRVLDEQPLIARLLGNLGAISVMQGNYPIAEQLLQESYDTAQRIGDGLQIATALCNLAEVEYLSKNYRAAEEHLWQSLKTASEVKDSYRAAMSLLYLGLVWCAKGEDTQTGQQLLRIAVESYAELGIPLPDMALPELEQYPAATTPGRGFGDTGLAALQFILDRWLPEYSM